MALLVSLAILERGTLRVMEKTVPTELMVAMVEAPPERSLLLDPRIYLPKEVMEETEEWAGQEVQVSAIVPELAELGAKAAMEVVLKSMCILEKAGHMVEMAAKALMVVQVARAPGHSRSLAIGTVVTVALLAPAATVALQKPS